jgi:anti-anti-sigma factor
MGARVVVFAGEYDVSYRALLREEFERLESVPALVLDFSGVTYLDSTCLCLLLKLRKARAANGTDRETIVVSHPHLKKIFEIIGVSQLLNVVDTLDLAVDPDAKVTVEHAFYGDPLGTAEALDIATLK